MAVSHKTNNNLINCNRCHLSFNYKNAVPKLLSCKHWYCFNCQEYFLYNTAKGNDNYLKCIQCQRSLIDTMKFQQNDEKLKMQLIPQNNNHNHILNNYNNNNNTNNNTNNSKMKTLYGCDDELFVQRDYGNNKSRSASLASEENTINSFTYFDNNNSNNRNNIINGGSISDLERNIHFGNRNAGSSSSSVTEKMLPGENCFIHGMPNTLWCQTCLTVLCRGCNAGLEHKDHKVENQMEAKEFYQNCVKQEFVQIKVQVEEIENLKLLQKNFLLNILEACCNLKLQIENELLATSNTSDIDDMKDTIKNLQLCFGLLSKQTPNEILKLYRITKDENSKLKIKHKQLLQQCKTQQLLKKSQKILDFDLLKEFYQKLDHTEKLFTNPAGEDSNNSNNNNNNENNENNSLLMLTNYCIYRLYTTYVRQQQQYIEEQVLRYQQYHQEQKKQNLLKQYKMLQQHNLTTLSLQNQQQQQHDTFLATQEFTFYIHDKEDDDDNKPKTYAEIATPQQNAHQFDLNDSTNNGFAIIQPPPRPPPPPSASATAAAAATASSCANNFQPYKKPLNKTTYEEPKNKKTVQLLFNPINNDNNQIYYFDFERNGTHIGRVLIKVFSDIAPKMSYNFHALATHEKGFGYCGCKVFECHPNESIITGDIEQNTGYSSRSIYEDVQFVPDDTNIAPFAGAVGMRRAKKKIHAQGLVGSQFRIILTELGFTAIFGCVIDGIEVIKKISQTLVQNDKINGSLASVGSINTNNSMNSPSGSNANPVAGIFITQCGLYEFVKRDIMSGI